MTNPCQGRAAESARAEHLKEAERLAQAYADAVLLGDGNDEALSALLAHIQRGVPEGYVAVPRFLAENHRNLTDVPRYQRILDDCLAAAPDQFRDAAKMVAEPAEVPMPEPVAYGFGNTAITGHTNRLMMVRLDVPLDDQYAGAFWLPLVLADEAHTYGVACRAAGEAAGYAQGLRDAVRDAAADGNERAEWEAVVFTLMGHAASLYFLGQSDMPNWFYELAEKLARRHVDEALAARVREVGIQRRAELAAATDQFRDAAKMMAAPTEVPMPEPDVVGYVERWGGACRDCADESGVCPSTGMPCGGARKAIEYVIRALQYGVTHGYISNPISGDAREAAGYARVLEWAVSRWRSEVENRPLENKNRRPLDDVWRQVVRFAGGDPDALLGPSHDAALRGEVKS